MGKCFGFEFFWFFVLNHTLLNNYLLGWKKKMESFHFKRHLINKVKSDWGRKVGLILWGAWARVEERLYLPRTALQIQVRPWLRQGILGCANLPAGSAVTWKLPVQWRSKTAALDMLSIACWYELVKCLQQPGEVNRQVVLFLSCR